MNKDHESADAFLGDRIYRREDDSTTAMWVLDFDDAKILADRCDEAEEEVERLKQEAKQSAFSTFHCHRCEITEDRLTQAHKALFYLYYEIRHAHDMGRPVPIDCVDMQIAKQILDSIKSPTPQDP